MQTHDKEIRRFFKHSSVQVLLCPRATGERHSWFKMRVSEIRIFCSPFPLYTNAFNSNMMQLMCFTILKQKRI